MLSRFYDGISWWFGMHPDYAEESAPPGITNRVIIPAHNEKGQLREAVLSLLKQTYMPTAILIVENGSTDGTYEVADAIAAEFAKDYPGLIHVLHTPALGSKARAINEGRKCDFKRGQFTTIMDADTVFDPMAFEYALRHFRNPKVGGVCGRVQAKPHTTKKPSVWLLGKCAEYDLSQGLTKAAQNSFALVVSAGCFSIFEDSILPDFEDDNMAEDMKVSWRIQIAGWRLVYEERAVCYAAEPEDFATYWNQRMRWFRGILQCYEQLAWEVCKSNWRLTIVIHYMFGLALMGLFLRPIAFYLCYKYHAIDALLPYWKDGLVMVVALGFYAYKHGGMKRVITALSLKGLIAMEIVTIVNEIAFVWAMVLEWFLEKRLKKWKSGHSQVTASVPT